MRPTVATARALRQPAVLRGAAKQRGVYTGRKPALTPEQAQQLRERATAGETKSALAKAYGISRETVYTYLRTTAAETS